MHLIAHKDAPQSVGLLWTRDRPVDLFHESKCADLTHLMQETISATGQRVTYKLKTTNFVICQILNKLEHALNMFAMYAGEKYSEFLKEH